MSDEHLINLEDDDAPTPPEAIAAPDPPSDTAPSASDPAASDPPVKPAEVESVEVGGQRYVPLATLLAEREKRQQLAPLAHRAQELEAWAQQNRAYIEFLQANPDFLRQPRQADSSPPVSTEPDPQLVDLARSLDLYDASGQPDTSRAAKIQASMAHTAEQKARELVQPFEDEQIQARATQGYYYLAQLTHADGTPINRQVVDFIWQQAAREPGGMKTLANRESLAGLALMALGADAQWRGKQTGAPPKPPPAVYTEPSGGNPRTSPKLSPLEERVAKERGVQPAQWAEFTKTYKSGATNVLED